MYLTIVLVLRGDLDAHPPFTGGFSDFLEPLLQTVGVGRVNIRAYDVPATIGQRDDPAGKNAGMCRLGIFWLFL